MSRWLGHASHSLSMLLPALPLLLLLPLLLHGVSLHSLTPPTLTQPQEITRGAILHDTWHPAVSHSQCSLPLLAHLRTQEITRRVNLHDIWQAVYTAGVLLPKPIAECQYWHRSLNPKKLIAIGFRCVCHSSATQETGGVGSVRDV